MMPCASADPFDTPGKSEGIASSSDNPKPHRPALTDHRRFDAIARKILIDS
jgi:hypothetical protein